MSSREGSSPLPLGAQLAAQVWSRKGRCKRRVWSSSSEAPPSLPFLIPSLNSLVSPAYSLGVLRFL